MGFKQKSKTVTLLQRRKVHTKIKTVFRNQFRIIKKQQNIMTMEMNFYFTWILLAITGFRQITHMITEVFYNELGIEFSFTLLLYQFYLENICKEI